MCVSDCACVNIQVCMPGCVCELGCVCVCLPTWLCVVVSVSWQAGVLVCALADGVWVPIGVATGGSTLLSMVAAGPARLSGCRPCLLQLEIEGQREGRFGPLEGVHLHWPGTHLAWVQPPFTCS